MVKPDKKAPGSVYAGSAQAEDVAALAAFQGFLDRINTALLGRDFETWRDCIALPFTTVTRNGTSVITDEEQLRRDFDLYMQEFEIHGIDDMFRQVLGVRMIETEQMVGEYRTHILRGASHVVDPYESAMTLRYENGKLRMTTVMNAIGHLNWHRRISPAASPSPANAPRDTPDRKKDK